jgi:flagellar basal-body rod modification protein FlgD
MYVGQASGALSQATSAGGKDEMGKDEFLRLLTTQLSNQDPLNPMDNTQFASQLAEFSGVEQLMNISSGMEQLAMAQAVNNGTDMIGFIGKEVVFHGNEFSFDGTDAEMTVDLSDNASKVTVSVYDENGKFVQTYDAGAMEEGIGEVSWDGMDLNGQPAPEGKYSFEVSAEDSDGNRVQVSTRRRGIVSGVTYESGFPELVIGSDRIAAGDVIEVITTADTSTSDGSPGSVTNMYSKET